MGSVGAGQPRRSEYDGRLRNTLHEGNMTDQLIVYQLRRYAQATVILRPLLLAAPTTTHAKSKNMYMAASSSVRWKSQQSGPPRQCVVWLAPRLDIVQHLFGVLAQAPGQSGLKPQADASAKR